MIIKGDDIINLNNWFQNVINSVQRSRDIVIQPYDTTENKSKKGVLTDPAWQTSPIFGVPRDIDYADLEQYEDDITVSAAINFITDAIATCDWSITGEGSPVEATNFFKSMAWDQSFESVLRRLVPDILHYDAGVLVVEFPEFCYDDQKNLIGSSKPVSITAKDGRSFLKDVTAFGDVKGYYQYSFLHGSQKPIAFTPEEIIYISERPQSKNAYGKSKLNIIKNVADLLLAIQHGHRAEQENALQIGGVIGHPNINDPERLKQLSTMYNIKLGGETNAKKWLVTGGDVEIQPVKTETLDSTWIEGARYYQESILSIFKVNRSILGMTTDVNRSTSETQASNFKINGITAMMELIEKILTREIVKKYFGKDLKFQFKREIDLVDEKMRAEIDTQNIASGLIDPNEIRSDKGLAPIKRIEKTIKGSLEDKTVNDLQDWNREIKKDVLKEIDSLYD